QAHLRDPAVTEPYSPRVGARLDDQFVLQPIGCAPIDQIYPGPEIAIKQSTIGPKPGLPLIFGSVEVTDYGCARVKTNGPGMWVSRKEIKLDGPSLHSFRRLRLERRTHEVGRVAPARAIEGPFALTLLPH